MDKYNPMEESGADFLARTAPSKFKPQTISIDDFRRRQREQRMALGVPQIDPDRYKVASDRPLNPDPPEVDYFTESNATQPSAPPSDKYGYFEYGDKRHENTGGGWNVLQPGQAAQDANIEREYQEKLRNKKPGNVTGKPLLPSKLFM